MNIRTLAPNHPVLTPLKRRMFNAHAHCFTIDHVPDYFAKGYTWIPLRISTLRKWGIVNWTKREFALSLRAHLGEDLFTSIGYDNPVFFLSNSVNKVLA